MPEKPHNFWEELRRRKVVRVITVYAAAAFVIIELTNNITEPLRLPEWVPTLVIVLLAIGFLISIVMSWVYDITPEGIQKTKPSTRDNQESKQPTSIGWKISTYISLSIIIAFVLFYFMTSIKKSSEISKLEKSIAVLPFENWNSDEEFAYLGDAITDEIILQLQYINEFDRVLSRSSTMQYKDNRPSIPEIGEQLGVNFIVEGSIQRQTDNVKISVQVLRAIQEDHVWAKEYEGEWKDIHNIQNDISKNVAKELKIVLTQNEIENIEKKPTENLEAYNYYLQGDIYYWRSYQEQDWSIAINMFQKAIELDPNFALAYTMLARCHLQLYWFHYDRSNERIRDSKEAIDAAYNIDPDLPDVNIALAFYYYQGFLNYPEALKQVETALQYLPNNAECNYLMACIYRRMGEWEKAEEKFVEAAENDPGNVRILNNTAETYYLLGDYERSSYYINKTRSLNPEFSSSYSINILLLLKCQGNVNEAIQTLDEATFFINTSSDTRLIDVTVLLYCIEGKYQSAIDFLNKTNFEAVGEQFYYYPKPLLYAMIYDLMKEKDKAKQYYTQSQISLETRLQDYPDDSRLYGALGICYAGLDKKEEAKEAGEYSVKLLPVSKEAYRGVYRLIDLAKIYVMVKEYDLALEKLDYVLSLPGELSVKFLQIDPRWKPLWELPEFQELIAKYSVNQ